MIVNCSPAADNAPETHGSLRFATRAKNVKNAAIVNQVRVCFEQSSFTDSMAVVGVL